MGEAFITQNAIPLGYSGEEERLIIDEETNTSNPLGKKDPREIMQEKKE